ncbi:hypothetical protein ACEQ8H_005750 [Pleosporales sp. CAS-2024a]
MASSTSPYFPRLGSCEFLELDEDELDTSYLHTRSIKSPHRDALLSRHHSPRPSSPRVNIDAATLLSDLIRLAPTVAKDLVAKYHAVDSTPLRLLNDISFQGIEDGYIALSYCRKKTRPDTPRMVVTPIGFGWSTTEEEFSLPTSNVVFQAVLREKRAEEGLWFDQVSINQDDEMERVASIGAIDLIYKNARAVVVALDDISVSADEEQFLRYYVEQYSYSELPDNQQPNVGLSPPLVHQFPHLASLVERILASTWFERAWCAHEMRLGRNHVFMVPCHRQFDGEVQTVIRITGVFFLHLLVLASEVYPTTGSPIYRGKLQSLHTFFQRIVVDEDTAFAGYRPDTPQMCASDRFTMIPTIAETFSLQAGGNPRLPEYLRRQDANRDKMGIAISASGLPLAMTAADTLSRPNIEDECLRSLLLVGIAARDPVALCTTGPHLRLHDGSISWLSRPTLLDANPNLAAPRRFFPSTTPIIQGSDGRAEYAQMDLLFLELPHRKQSIPFFPTQVARARTLIDLCIQFQLEGSSLWNSWQVPNHPRAATMRNTFIQTLACVLECGSLWLIELSSRLTKPHSPTLAAHTIEMLLSPQLMTRNYILLPEGQVSLSLLLTFLSNLISSGIPWASGATEYNCGPMIVTSPVPQSMDNTDMFCGYPHVGKAIMFAPFEHSKTLLIAVPASVKEAHYDNFARGWILTSMNPYTGSPKGTVSWTLQNKGVIFGDGDFNAGLERCQDVRNHRVYGPSAS